jgi:uncharacterized repeat protein (TIGR03943 family)
VRDRRTQGTMLLAVGGMALFLGASDLTLSYVRAFLRPLLLASGAVLVALALVALVRRGADDADPHHGPAIGWLLVLPLLVLVLVAPGALGSYAAARRPAVGTAAGGGSVPPVGPAVDGAVPMDLSEFVYRAALDERHSLNGVRVRLLGFAAPSRGGRGYLLARFAMFCCAADAQVVEVAVQGDGVQRRPDQWLLVEGYLRPSTATGNANDPDPSDTTPELVADSVKPVPPPRDRYEHSLYGY